MVIDLVEKINFENGVVVYGVFPSDTIGNQPSGLLITGSFGNMRMMIAEELYQNHGCVVICIDEKSIMMTVPNRYMCSHKSGELLISSRFNYSHASKKKKKKVTKEKP